jgi:alpha-glucosidase
LRLRNESLRGDESLTWSDLGPGVLAFRRGGGVACVVNFGSEGIAVPDGEIILSSASLDGDLIPQDTAVWVSTTR